MTSVVWETITGDGESLGDYFARIARYRLLTPAEELRLAKRVERGDEAARRLLIESNLRLVVALAKTYRGLGVPFSDLIQEGALGLMRAVEKFDWRRGCKLSTYAGWWIRHSLQAAVVHQARTITVPRHVLDRQQRLAAAARSLEAELGRTATVDQLARATGIPAGHVDELLAGARVTVSLDHELGAGGGELGDVIADPAASLELAELEQADREQAVREVLAALPELQRQVLELRFGFAGESLSFETIAARLGMSADLARKLHRNGLRRLQIGLGAGGREALLAA